MLHDYLLTSTACAGKVTALGTQGWSGSEGQRSRGEPSQPEAGSAAAVAPPCMRRNCFAMRPFHVLFLGDDGRVGVGGPDKANLTLIKVTLYWLLSVKITKKVN